MHIKNKKIEIPQSIMIDRKFNRETFLKAKLAGLSPVAAKILANRGVEPDTDLINNIINPSFQSVNLDVYKLKDIEKAADRISDAIINNEVIGLLCDFDVDGISSAAVLYSAFIDYFNFDPTKIKMLISNRMMYGYGFREEILQDILDMGDKPTLLITADQGSSDEDRIKKYNIEMEKLGYDKHDVIVTDHHHIKGQGPVSAFAVVNPQRHDDNFPDKTICGCTVALFTMVATRDYLIKKNYLKPDAPKLSALLTYSTAATIADCVSMSSPLNRAIVKRGLHDINNETIPAWKIMKQNIVGDNKRVSAASIGFGLGPRINACSRTGGSGLVALKFYLADTEKEAERYLNMLETMNEDRKKIEKELVMDAMMQASELYKKNYYTLVIYLPNGHHGIHGIAASRITEKYGRPVIIFSPKDKEEITVKVNGKDKKEEKVITVSGSGRSVDNINIYDVLAAVEEQKHDTFIGFGGHEMAAGMTMNIENIDQFREDFERIARLQMNNQEPLPKVWIDGTIKENRNIDFSLLDEVQSLEPYGNGFEEPIFKARVYISNTNVVGKTKETLKINFIHNELSYTGMLFKYDQHPMYQKIENNKLYDIAFTLNESFWKGNRQLNVFINHIHPIN